MKAHITARNKLSAKQKKDMTDFASVQNRYCVFCIFCGRINNFCFMVTE